MAWYFGRDFGLSLTVILISIAMLRWSFKPANRQEENEPWRSKNVGSSGHSGIVQIAFGDGSVRCIPKKIDDDVLKKLLLKGLPSDEYQMLLFEYDKRQHPTSIDPMKTTRRD